MIPRNALLPCGLKRKLQIAMLATTPLSGCFGGDEREGSCLPLKPNLVVNLTTIGLDGEGVAGTQVFGAFIASDEMGCKEIQELATEASGACLLPDGRMLAFRVNGFAASTTIEDGPEGVLAENGDAVALTITEEWTLITAPQKPDGHRDEVCVETFSDTFTAR